jgi:hypothetical protein
MSAEQNKQTNLYRLLAGIGIITIILAYFLPTWYVALHSIQYPKSMYPDGIRINFKFNGVYNGCQGQQEREELASSQAGADCLTEMNAINHFIGMYHITQGRNRDKNREYPIYYVFDTKKDEAGNDILGEDGQPIKEDVTPGFLKFIDTLMIASPYIFLIFILMVLYFMFTPKKVNAFFAAIPALLPVWFLTFYIWGLYWYGHNLSMHGGGAFSGIKPFMPTVFGEGKVAQFSTHSYPYIGFWVAVLTLVTLVMAILIRKKALAEEN